VAQLTLDSGQHVGIHKRGGLLYVRNVTVSRTTALSGVPDSGFGILLEGALGD
jgi:hypothetical protein